MIPVTLTDAARERVQGLTSQKPGASGIILRIAKGKGCGGNEYRMEHMVDEQPGFDKIEAGNGAALFIPMSDSFLMFGMVVDYGSDDLGNEKFLFHNPNESGRCGCGESFSIDPGKLKKTGGPDRD